MPQSNLALSLPQPFEHDTCRVETVTTREAFVDLEQEWNDAVDRAGITHPFLRHEWIRTWWDCFEAGRCLHIIVVRAGGRIIAIAPLMWESARMYGVPIRRLRLLHNDHTPRCDFIVAERPDDAYRAIWSALASRQDTWDILQFGQLPRHSTTLKRLTALAESDGHTTGTWQSGDSPYVRLTGTWDEYFASLTAKFRQNVRNRLSRARRIGEPGLEIVTGGRELERDCDDVVRLEASGWKASTGTAISCDPAIRRFYAQLAALAAERGWLRLLFLNVNGDRIATSYSLAYRDRLFLCKTGYDPRFETVSPFKVLTYLALRQSFDDRFVEVDFLGDPEAWKLEWTSATRAHDWLFVFSRAGRGRLLGPVKFQLVPALKRSGLAGLIRR